MTWDWAIAGRDAARRHAGRGAGGAALSLVLMTASGAVAQTPRMTTPGSEASAYDTCVRRYRATNAARTRCAALYPDSAPQATPSPADQLIKALIARWEAEAAKTPAPPVTAPPTPAEPTPTELTPAESGPATPVPPRQAVSDPTPPAKAKPGPKPVRPKPPAASPPGAEPASLATTVQAPPVKPPAVKPPLAVAPPAIVAPERRSAPVWPWLVVVAAIVAVGVGAARGLGRARRRSRRPGQPAACDPPHIALVADPGVVVLTPDGPPRAGMAVSMRIDLGLNDGEVRLDTLSLEAAP